MKKRAVVLGGGGTVGIAWELGLAAGLLESGIDLSVADLFVGTSAGSVVSTLLANGLDPGQILAFHLAAANSGAGVAAMDLGPMDPEAVQAVMAKWTGAEEMTPDFRRELGQIALSARTVPEESWVGGLGQLLGMMEEWPTRPLKITAVEASTGDFQVWDANSGVPLYKAVASSCTVPGLFPPVTMNGSRYVDGGVRSGTNADLAAGHDAVLVIAPMATERHPLGSRQMNQELAVLRTEGAATAQILPDDEALAAFGYNFMDAARAAAAAEAGMRQGRAAAAAVAAVWA